MNYLWLVNIRELRLVCSFGAKEVFEICKSAFQLETLSLATTEPHNRHATPRDPLPGRDINSALLLRAHTLKVLEFRVTGKEFFLCQLGNSKLLTCLPSLIKLEKLTTEIPLLSKFDQKDKSDTLLLSKLPPNIVSLELIEWPTFPPDMPKRLNQSRDLADSLLKALAFMPLRGLPRLRRLHYLRSPFNPYYNNEEIDRRMSWFDRRFVVTSWASDSLQHQMRIFYGFFWDVDK
ncbi:uncharacterized protein GGS22DRAFT_68543 [Annulohypoxylon maeteangense]|uniref:uncharacterized protein n=1 Tax=Annulohypoxylon maeteangense TaxID=1927788 RepID=UPI0020078F08|nr:uncharacterized protein GGS22DRAFT_68543 [Annulohypoxylon maeteangense]KAI0889198.1 hypothetical protein GGS22DRAFT_68543 [Annulohypoxylon maeteangense]